MNNSLLTAFNIEILNTSPSPFKKRYSQSIISQDDVEKGSSATSWMKRILKIQKVLIMLEKKAKPPNLSQASTPLCSLFQSILRTEKEQDPYKAIIDSSYAVNPRGEKVRGDSTRLKVYK